jgi:hypothetical protein
MELTHLRADDLGPNVLCLRDSAPAQKEGLVERVLALARERGVLPREAVVALAGDRVRGCDDVRALALMPKLDQGSTPRASSSTGCAGRASPESAAGVAAVRPGLPGAGS